MTERKAEYANETDRGKLKDSLTTELALLQKIVSELINSKPKSFVGDSGTPIENIGTNEARLLLHALQALREGITSAEKFATALPEDIKAGLAVIAGAKFGTDAVREDLGSVTDTTRARIDGIMKI